MKTFDAGFTVVYVLRVKLLIPLYRSALVVPTTSNVNPGVIVPIPTFPVADTDILGLADAEV